MSEQKFPPRVWGFPYINEDNVEYYECDIQPFAKGMDEQYLSLAEHQALLESEKAKTADELRNYQECLKTLNAVSSGKRELEEKNKKLVEALKFYVNLDWKVNTEFWQAPAKKALEENEK